MSVEKTFYLLETFDPSIDLTKGHCISLSPQASYQLGLRGIKYSLLENYYSESALRGEEAAYFSSQMEWFGRLSELVDKRISADLGRKVPLLDFSYYRIKSIIDALVIQAYMVLKFLERESFSQIVYVGSGSSGEASIYGKPVFFFRLMERWQDAHPERKVILRYQLLKSADSDKKSCSAGKGPSLAFFTKRWLKIIRNFFFYKKHNIFFQPLKPWKDLNVLFLNSGSDRIDPAIQNFLAKGSKVFLKTKNDIFELSSCFEKKRFGIPSVEDDPESSRFVSLFQNVWQDFSGDRFFCEWIDRACQIKGAHELILPHLQSFFTLYCPEVLRQAKALSGFLKAHRIHHVIATSVTDRESLSGILAAHATEGAKTVCFEHGSTVQETKTLPLTELHPFDYYFTGDSITEKILSRMNSLSCIAPARVSQNPARYQHLRGLHRGALKPSHVRRRILYIPSKLTSLHKRIMGNMIYPVTWFFEVQKALLDYFSSRSDCEFIYKTIVSAHWMSEAAIPYIKRQKYKNVTVVSDLPLGYLRSIDRVILDRPTTSFSEMIAAGFPVLCLYHETLPISNEAFSFARESLKKFSSSEQAIAHIKQFIDAAPEAYRVLQPEPSGEILEELYFKKNELLPLSRAFIKWGNAAS